jgi:hypothetical protein
MSNGKMSIKNLKCRTKTRNVEQIPEMLNKNQKCQTKTRNVR